jgi:hypothetical protein
VVIGARLGQGGPGAIMLLRAAGGRAIFLVPVMMVVPAVLGQLVELSNGWASGYNTAASASATNAITGYESALGKIGGAEGVLGGVVTLLLLRGVIALFALFLTAELLAAGFGVYLAGLLVPFALAVAVYPPARAFLSRVIGLLAGLLLVPPIAFLAFQVAWGAVGGIGAADGPTGVFNAILYAAVAVVVAVVFPLLVAFMISRVIGERPGHEDLAGELSYRGGQLAGEAGGVMDQLAARRAARGDSDLPPAARPRRPPRRRRRPVAVPTAVRPPVRVGAQAARAAAAAAGPGAAAPRAIPAAAAGTVPEPPRGPMLHPRAPAAAAPAPAASPAPPS